MNYSRPCLATRVGVSYSQLTQSHFKQRLLEEIKVQVSEREEEGSAHTRVDRGLNVSISTETAMRDLSGSRVRDFLLSSHSPLFFWDGTAHITIHEALFYWELVTDICTPNSFTCTDWYRCERVKIGICVLNSAWMGWAPALLINELRRVQACEIGALSYFHLWFRLSEKVYLIRN